VCTFECNVALHVDTTTSTNGTYEISQESAEGVSEDQVDVIKEISEAPNQVQKITTLTSLASVPPVKASPGHIPLFYLHCNLRLLLLYLALSLGAVMKP
jgi:hypothetical protein